MEQEAAAGHVTLHIDRERDAVGQHRADVDVREAEVALRLAGVLVGNRTPNFRPARSTRAITGPSFVLIELAACIRYVDLPSTSSLPKRSCRLWIVSGPSDLPIGIVSPKPGPVSGGNGGSGGGCTPGGGGVVGCGVLPVPAERIWPS